MAGEAGYTFTSSTGAKLRLAPSSRNMRPMPRAVRRVASGVPRPISAAEGYAGKAVARLEAGHLAAFLIHGE